MNYKRLSSVQLAVDVDQRRIIVNKLLYFVNQWEYHTKTNSCQSSGLGSYSRTSPVTSFGCL